MQPLILYRLRHRWYATSKAPWLAVTAVALVLTGFAWMVRSSLAAREEARNLTCLAMNVYFEARGESLAGQQAVAEVTLNRVASGRYPNTVCAVVFQKNWDPLRGRYVGAFSWTEFEAVTPPSGEAWERSLEVAEAAYAGRVPPRLRGALHYHAERIRPSWARERRQIARIGNHIFYR
jgi:spore germination cell wall hydrolase CwlJ-like protein